MDWMTFVVELLKALAWPAVAMLALTLYREPISQLISTLNTLRFKTAGLEVEMGAKKAKKLSESIQLPPTERKIVSEASLLARESPKLAIEEAWHSVESSAKTRLSKDADISPTELKTELESLGDFGTEKFRLFTELQQLRDKAVRLPEYVVSTSTAENYVEAPQKLTDYFATTKKSV